MNYLFPRNAAFCLVNKSNTAVHYAIIPPEDVTFVPSQIHTFWEDYCRKCKYTPSDDDGKLYDLCRRHNIDFYAVRDKYSRSGLGCEGPNPVCPLNLGQNSVHRKGWTAWRVNDEGEIHLFGIAPHGKPDWHFKADVPTPFSFVTDAYRCGNVYGSGKVCWGYVDTPTNLRQAEAAFWASSFNDDLTIWGNSTVDFNWVEYFRRSRDQDYSASVIGLSKDWYISDGRPDAYHRSGFGNAHWIYNLGKPNERHVNCKSVAVPV